MHSKFIWRFSLTALVIAGTSCAFADSVAVVDPGYTGTIWQNWSASQISNTAWQTSQQTPNQPYWNNSSWDGANENVGACLAVATSGCKVPGQPGNIPYLGQSNGQAFTNFYFDNNGPVTATLEAQVAGDAPNDVLGWYNAQNPTQYGIIFNGTTAVGTTVTFDPTAEYGLFLYNGTSGVNELYLMDSADNSIIQNLFGQNPVYEGAGDTNYQHFTVFQQSVGTYYVGAEDLPSSNTDFDYNDMVVELATDPAPEPASFLLLGFGLTGFGVVALRRKKASEYK